jgi:hypothetical protein
MDQLLFHLGGKAASRREMLRVGPAGWDHDGSKAPPPSDRGRRGVGGAETPTPASTRGGCSAPDWLATCPRRSWYPSFGGDSGRCILADLDVTEATMQGGRWHGKLVSGQAQIQLPTFGLPGHRQPCKAWVRPWRPCGPIASPAWPGLGCRGRNARGPHRGCPRPGGRGRPDPHGGGGAGAGTWSGAGRESEQPPPSIPGGWFRESNRWQRLLRRAARRVARPTRQVGWQSVQGPERRPGRARRPR